MGPGNGREKALQNTESISGLEFMGFTEVHCGNKKDASNLDVDGAKESLADKIPMFFSIDCHRRNSLAYWEKLSDLETLVFYISI